MRTPYPWTKRIGLLLATAWLVALSPVSATAQVRALGAASAATIEATPSADPLQGAAPEVRAAFDASPRGADARTALARQLAPGKPVAATLAASLANPFFAPYSVEAALNADTLDGIPGVERVFDRIARARDDSGPRGGAFELTVGARLRPRLQELSATVNGHEVDALLIDGTVVEAKYAQGRRTGPLVAKARDQLKLRGGGDRKVMLAINRQLHTDQMDLLANDLGEVDLLVIPGDGSVSEPVRLRRGTPVARPLLRLVQGGAPRLAPGLETQKSLTSTPGVHQGQRVVPAVRKSTVPALKRSVPLPLRPGMKRLSPTAPARQSAPTPARPARIAAGH